MLTGITVVALAAAILLQLVPDHADVDVLVDIMAFTVVILFALRAWILMEQLSHANAALARTEADLQERSALVAGISEAMPGALFAGDLATMANDYASQGLRTLLGVDSASAIGKPGWIVERIHPDDRDEFVAMSTAAQAEGTPVRSYENRMRTEDGGYRHVASTFRYLRGPRGQLNRFVAVAVDVTDRFEGERRSHERETLIAHLAQASSAIIIAAHRGRDGEVIDFISPSIEQVLGYRPEEIIGVPGFVQSRIHPGRSIGARAAARRLGGVPGGGHPRNATAPGPGRLVPVARALVPRRGRR
jgi:PAS domain S-box-containing protein